MHVAIPAEIEALFRRESRRLISVLTRILGPGNLELAEDVLQDAFIAAMREWTSRGVPENPPAWLLTAARNRAIDVIRRERTRRTFAADLAMYLDSEWTLARTVDEAFGENWIRDDQLRMIFMCCHPLLPLENRVTLIRQGFGYLARSSSMEAVIATPLHLEAAIAARHCEAATFDETDWASICSLYDRLLAIDPSPMVELNRAVAVSFRDGPQAAIPIVESIRSAGRLPHSHVVAAVLANLYARAGADEPARRFLDEALARTRNPHERELIALQINRALN